MRVSIGRAANKELEWRMLMKKEGEGLSSSDELPRASASAEPARLRRARSSRSAQDLSTSAGQKAIRQRGTKGACDNEAGLIKGRSPGGKCEGSEAFVYAEGEERDARGCACEERMKVMRGGHW